LLKREGMNFFNMAPDTSTTPTTTVSISKYSTVFWPRRLESRLRMLVIIPTGDIFMVLGSPSFGLTSKSRRQNQHAGELEQVLQLTLQEPVHPGKHGDQRQRLECNSRPKSCQYAVIKKPLKFHFE
jgi:hypothetical protein